MSSKPKQPKTSNFDFKDDFGTTEEFVCRVCGEVLSTLANYVEHSRRKHKALVDNNCIGIPKKCNLCSVYFVSDVGLQNHLQDVHAVVESSPDSTEIDVNLEFAINESKRKIQKASSRMANALVITSYQSNSVDPKSLPNVQETLDVPDVVPLPALVTAPIVAVNDEIRTQTAHEGTFKCRFCNKMSRSSRDHVRHVQNCNPNATLNDIFDDPHQCPLCQRIFQTRIHLERHFHMKHRGQPWGIMDANIGAYDACNELKNARASIQSNRAVAQMRQNSNQHETIPRS